MALPFVQGIIFYGEKLTLAKGVCFVIITVALILTIEKGEKKKIKTGKPSLKDVVCEAEVIAHGKDSKIVVFKYKAKKNERKKQGHRQPFTQVKIVEIATK